MSLAVPRDALTPPSGGSATAEFPELTGEEQQRLAWMLQTLFPPAWRVGLRFGLSGAQADEIAQEAFVVAARRLPNIEPGHERAYVLGVALRLASNARRLLSQRVERVAEFEGVSEPTDGLPLAEEVLAQRRRCEALDRILNSMSAVLSEVLVLYEIEELTLPEIAEALGIPENTAASRLRRARIDFSRRVHQHASLRERLEEP